MGFQTFMSNGQVLPLYEQVKAYVIDSVERGEFRAGEQIPSQRELCERFNISLMTARRAINELISEGVIYAIHGKGLFVAEKKQQAEIDPLVSFTDDMLQRGMYPTSRLLESSLITCSPFFAHLLAVNPSSELVYITRLRLADNQPIAIQSNYIVHRLCPGILQHDFERQGLFEILRTEYGLRLNDTQTTVEAALATEEESTLLGVALPAALLRTEQITLLDSGLAIEFARTLYRGDRYYKKLPSRS